MIETNVRNCIERMLACIESADYAGYDPYDALNSPLIQRLGAGSKAVRMGATQLLRRCPVNVRPALGVRKAHNPKGIGLFLWGYARLHALTPEPRYRERVDYLLDLLERLRCEGYAGNCWGYNFDWQSRTCLRPKGTPTIVNTSFIGHALLDCHELTGSARALEMALPIKDFILGDLHRTRLDGSFCFSYTPVDTETVHNANLLGASILARLSRYCDDDRLVRETLASLKYSMLHQRPDGSWFYADTDIQRWIDSFHTGFNLQAIRYILDAGLAREYRAAYHRGVQYYARNFFLEDGTPKYYHDRVYPIDIHAPAQAISFFSQEGPQYRELTDRIMQWMLTNMYSGQGSFYFRKGRFFTNRIPYMRWSQAWAFHALTEYLLARRSGAWDGTSLNNECSQRERGVVQMFASTVKTTDILGVPVTCFCSYDHATAAIVRRIRRGEKTLCIAINPEKVCCARNDPTFRDIVRKGHVHICDGIGAALAVRWLTGWRIPRVTGVGLFHKLIETAQREELSIFLLGARPEVNRRACEILQEHYPGLRIAGRRDGYFQDAAEVIGQINASGADILFAALGSPRQEKWLAEHLDAIQAPFCMGVGGTFDVLTGHVRRAPGFFQRTGTEFLYRLICEPRRWRRQSVLPGFAVRALAEALSTRGWKALSGSREIRSVYGWSGQQARPSA